jgi:hypothetical protein
MKSATWISPLFWVAAAYDGVLGLMFLLAPAALFELCQVTPPNHFGYVQFPAALLIIFGWIFGTIARDPLLYRFMIPYGILLKVAYCGIAGWYWMSAGVPWIWKPFVIVDLVMGVLFVWAYQTLAQSVEENTDSPAD